MNEDIVTYIQKCLAGNKQCWDHLRARILHQLRGRHRNLSEDHEDIAQEIAIRLVGGLRQFNGTTCYEFESYLGTIVHHTAETYRCRPSQQSVTDELNNKENRRLSRLQIDTPKDPILINPARLPLEEQQDSCLSPERIAEIRDLCAKAGAMLSARDMRLVLYKADGYQDQEIADILDMTTGGIGVTYSRIKSLLRKLLLFVLLVIFLERKLSLAKSLWI